MGSFIGVKLVNQMSKQRLCAITRQQGLLKSCFFFFATFVSLGLSVVSRIDSKFKPKKWKNISCQLHFTNFAALLLDKACAQQHVSIAEIICLGVYTMLPTISIYGDQEVCSELGCIRGVGCCLWVIWVLVHDG